MRKIYIILLICIVLFSCNSKYDILSDYQELSYSDYYSKYTYLTKPHKFKSIDYTSLINKLDNNDSFVLYIGGDWCINCQSAIPFINERFTSIIDEDIYNFDPRISKDKDSTTDIRNKNNGEYYQLFIVLLDKLSYNEESLRVPAVFSIIDGKYFEAVIGEYIYNVDLEILEDSNKEDVTEYYLDKLTELFNNYLSNKD